MKSIWKGHLKFGMLILPIKLYNAINTAENIHFNQLHKEDKSPIGYDKKCKKCGVVCKDTDIIKGYATGKDEYVTLTQEEIESVKIKSTKIVDIGVFVDPDLLSEISIDAPYFLAPDGPVAFESYGLLRQALIDTKKVGIGKLAIHGRENLVGVIPYKNSLVLYKLRYPSEVTDINQVPDLNKILVPTPEKRALAKSLVESMVGDLDQIDMTDRYRTALWGLIEAKIAGTEPEVSTEEVEEKPATDIMAVLKASIEASKTKKKPSKAASKK